VGPLAVGPLPVGPLAVGPLPVMKYVCEQLMDVYGVACTASDVLNLDSSTEDKFNRHLIFCVDGAVFSDNIHMGTGWMAVCLHVWLAGWMALCLSGCLSV